METGRQFKINYALQVKQHLQAIDQKYYSLIRNTIAERLRFQPDVETRNRKPLKRPVEFEADWEIRFGPNNKFRVFYEIDHNHSEVHILAIDVKLGNRLFIGGKEFDL